MKLPCSLLFLLLCSIISATPTVTSLAQPNPHKPNEHPQNKDKNADDLTSKPTQDPSGVTHLGLDGILRQYDGTGKVTNFDQFSPARIKQYNDCFPEKDLLAKAFHGVDGRKVTDKEQCLHPGEQYKPKYDGDDKSKDGDSDKVKDKNGVQSKGLGDDDKKDGCEQNRCRKHEECVTRDCSRFCGMSGALPWGYCQ
ncbi:hypothetical protein BDV23DRAFT_185940 [Aspergillus alliaceus]|uniref:Uncharacterized protein n=1 Tax=Petromyces alliaceus TaxID=209559 RepID=A0A5N6G056_PETAA|nr:uncharacterized protein BDW43DRAFT_310112 [Aspergillus alliaceus]KAB8234444.1 hypothetical protein BDW43DRAFT_310112 [Aspergillus alliaceus]KAE8387798.1 hypothetical protein BDV23DRAFT_185940 [Aspergillus alliaceus]